MTAARPRLVVLDSATFGDVSLDPFKVHWDCESYALSRAAEVPKRLQGCRAVVVNKVALDRAVLQRPEVGELGLIAVAATGTDNIDLRAARSRGIGVCNVPGYATTAVAQFTMALMLEWASHPGRYGELVRRGLWQRSPVFARMDFRSVELRGKRLGIVGYGNIGRAVARMARGLGLKVDIARRDGLRSSSRERRVPLRDLLEASDIVTLHCPLTPRTKHLVNRRTLALMKPTALLINTARGGVVDEQALVEWLRKTPSAGAALDVLTEEPPSKRNPTVRAARQLNNLLVTPHCAWTAIEARERLVQEVARNLRAFLQGKSRNRIL